jgi:hypothetical protein
MEIQMSGSGGIDNRDLSRGTSYNPNPVQPIQKIRRLGQDITIGGPESQGYMQPLKESVQPQTASYSNQRPYQGYKP